MVAFFFFFQSSFCICMGFLQVEQFPGALLISARDPLGVNECMSACLYGAQFHAQCTRNRLFLVKMMHYFSLSRSLQCPYLSWPVESQQQVCEVRSTQMEEDLPHSQESMKMNQDGFELYNELCSITFFHLHYATRCLLQDNDYSCFFLINSEV